RGRDVQGPAAPRAQAAAGGAATMKCDEVSTLLDEYVDAELAPQARDAVARHLLQCAACAAEEQGLRALVSAAATLPRELTPARDLWPGVSERMRAVVPFPRRGGRFQPMTL